MILPLKLVFSAFTLKVSTSKSELVWQTSEQLLVCLFLLFSLEVIPPITLQTVHGHEPTQRNFFANGFKT